MNVLNGRFVALWSVCLFNGEYLIGEDRLCKEIHPNQESENYDFT